MNGWTSLIALIIGGFTVIGILFNLRDIWHLFCRAYQWVKTSPLLRLKAYIYLDRNPPQPHLVAILYTRKRSLPTLGPQQYENTEYWKPHWRSRRWFKKAIYNTLALDGRFTVKDIHGHIVEWSWPVLEIRDRGQRCRCNLVGVKPDATPVIHPHYRWLLGHDARMSALLMDTLRRRR